MKKILMTIALAFACATPAFAIDTKGLSKEAIAELEAKAEALKKEPTNVSATVRKEAEEWGALGANMGKAMIGAAREIGVAANEFSQTPLGKLTAALVVYKLVGHDLLGIVFGTLTLVVGTILAVWVARTKAFYTRTYEIKPFLFGLWNRKVVASVSVEEDVAFTKMAGAGILLVLTWIVGLNSIF